MFIKENQIKKLQRKLEKVIKEIYVDADGELYCEIEKITIDREELSYYFTYTIRYGRQGGEHSFQEKVELDVGDNKHNLDFIAGQFFQIVFFGQE